VLRPNRLLRLLLLVLLAFLPFQTWAGGVTHERGMPRSSEAVPAYAAVATPTDAVVAGAPLAPNALDVAGSPALPDPVELPAPGQLPLAEAGEPAPAGADLAEQLLPAAPLRLAAGPACAGLPGYARAALPEPHLPLPPRPPRG
jgi:hypothetical protein